MAENDLELLLAVARRRDRPADEVWPAAAAAIELLWWHDRFTDARQLAEDVLRDFADKPGRLFDHRVPFDEALLMGAGPAGENVTDVLRAAMAFVPRDTVLGKDLTWLLDNVRGKEPHELVSGALLEKPPRALRPRDAELAQRDPAELDDTERRRLWLAADRAKDYDLACRLLSLPGEQPPRWYIAAWLAGRMIAEGQISKATDLLVANLEIWIPYENWDLVPTDLVLQPRFRPALTTPLRTAVLDSADISTLPGIA